MASSISNWFVIVAVVLVHVFVGLVVVSIMRKVTSRRRRQGISDPSPSGTPTSGDLLVPEGTYETHMYQGGVKNTIEITHMNDNLVLTGWSHSDYNQLGLTNFIFNKKQKDQLNWNVANYRGLPTSYLWWWQDQSDPSVDSKTIIIIPSAFLRSPIHLDIWTGTARQVDTATEGVYIRNDAISPPLPAIDADDPGDDGPGEPLSPHDLLIASIKNELKALDPDLEVKLEANPELLDSIMLNYATNVLSKASSTSGPGTGGSTESALEFLISELLDCPDSGPGSGELDEEGEEVECDPHQRILDALMAHPEIDSDALADSLESHLEELAKLDAKLHPLLAPLEGVNIWLKDFFKVVAEFLALFPPPPRDDGKDYEEDIEAS